MEVLNVKSWIKNRNSKKTVDDLKTGDIELYQDSNSRIITKDELASLVREEVLKFKETLKFEKDFKLSNKNFKK